MSGGPSAPWGADTLEPVTPSTAPRPYGLGDVSFRQLDPGVSATLDVVASTPDEAVARVRSALARQGFARGGSVQLTRNVTRSAEPMAAGTILVTYEAHLRADRTRGRRVRRIALLLIATAVSAAVLTGLALAGVLTPTVSLTVLAMAAGGLLGVGMNLLPTYDFWSEILVLHVPPPGTGASSAAARSTVRVEVRCATARTQNSDGGGFAFRHVKATYLTPAASDAVRALADDLSMAAAAPLE